MAAPRRHRTGNHAGKDNSAPTENLDNKNPSLTLSGKKRFHQKCFSWKRLKNGFPENSFPKMVIPKNNIHKTVFQTCISQKTVS